MKQFFKRRHQIIDLKRIAKPFAFLLITGSCLAINLDVTAQIIPQEEPITTLDELKKPKPEWLEKLHYGGNLWLGFFGAFYVDVSPMVGYEITKSGTTAGIGGSFIYQGQFRGQNGQLAAGPRIFVRQPVWRSFFVHAEYELMNATENRFYSYFDNGIPNPNLKRKWEGSPLIGAGFYQGRNRQQGGSFISLMYNLGYPSVGFISPQGIGGNNSPFVVRFGFFF